MTKLWVIRIHALLYIIYSLYIIPIVHNTVCMCLYAGHLMEHRELIRGSIPEEY